jgi:Arc/MetJ-type ribon-helix-helix transcriptional regulator
MARVTFSLDDATVARIRQTAARLRRPQSHVVREAVAEYAARADRLSETERQHALGILARLRDQKPTRPAADVDRELASLRTARRAGGRRTPPR